MAIEPRDRVIRVFVSSTFRDFGAERDELARHVFPRIRRLCEERNVVFADIDLRWGIPDEVQSEVLPRCLRFIEECRPFFIGMLGERYGWVPEGVSEDLVRQHGWLGDHAGASVTEFEILHGVLNDPEMAGRAYFYLRDPAYVEHVPAAQRADYVSASAESRQRLAALKDRVRASGLPVRDGYASPQEFGRLVAEDLERAIDELYPPSAVADPLEVQRAQHGGYADARRRVYVARKSSEDALDDAVRACAPIVVTGPAGSGKSALLANWVHGTQAVPDGTPVVVHYAGASAMASEAGAFAVRVASELATALGFRRPEREGMRPERMLAETMRLADANGGALLVIDGVDQLDEAVRSLAWLDIAATPRMRVVLSTQPGPVLDETWRRGWAELVVEPLSVAERERLIGMYLAQFGKDLSPTLREVLAAAPQCANPLFLRVLLEEVRLGGEHDRLRETLLGYLAATEGTGLFDRVLSRWEADYSREVPGLVRDAMSLIAVSRRGLTQAELLDMLGTNGEPLPFARFADLWAASDVALVTRSGFITFGHQDFRMAVEHRYLGNSKACDAYRSRVADYFLERTDTARAVEELPHQLAESGRWRLLADALVSPQFLARLAEAEPHAPLAAWLSIAIETGLKPAKAYAAVIRLPVGPYEGISVVSDVLLAADAGGAANRMWRRRRWLVWRDSHEALRARSMALKTSSWDVPTSRGAIKWLFLIQVLSVFAAHTASLWLAVRRLGPDELLEILDSELLVSPKYRERLLDRIVADAEAAGDSSVELRAKRVRARAALFPDSRQAEQLRECVERALELGDVDQALDALLELARGSSWRHRNDPAAERTEIAAIADRIEEISSRAALRYGLAEAAYLRGRCIYDAAREKGSGQEAGPGKPVRADAVPYFEKAERLFAEEGRWDRFTDVMRVHELSFSVGGHHEETLHLLEAGIDGCRRAGAVKPLIDMLLSAANITRRVSLEGSSDQARQTMQRGYLGEAVRVADVMGSGEQREQVAMALGFFNHNPLLAVEALPVPAWARKDDALGVARTDVWEKGKAEAKRRSNRRIAKYRRHQRLHQARLALIIHGKGPRGLIKALRALIEDPEKREAAAIGRSATSRQERTRRRA